MTALGHSGCHPGKKVRIKLKHGDVIFGKFERRTDKDIYLADGTKVPKVNIKSFSILKPTPPKAGD